MKANKLYVLTGVILMLMICTAPLASSAQGKFKVVAIKTSAICGSCKSRIEKVLKAHEGVEEALLNLNNKVVKVKYKPEVTSPEQIRRVIADAGYQADDVLRNEDAYSKLPECCQRIVPGDPHR